VTQFCHLFGVLSGGILATFMLKHIEPRQVMLIGMITQIICGNLTGWATTFELHIFFRCLSASCCALMYTAGGMICKQYFFKFNKINLNFNFNTVNDITGGKYKVIANCMFEQFWSIGLLLLPAIASYWPKWNYLYMAISFPTVILIGLYPLIPNSPRWLLQKGRIEEAKEILLQAARMNGKTDFSVADLDKQLQIQARDVANAPKEPKYWAIWKGQIKNIICVHFAWSAYIIVYYGFLLNIRNFGVHYLEENTIICGEIKLFNLILNFKKFNVFL
jgi:MFS family permease